VPAVRCVEYGAGEQFGVAESVGDAVCGDRVLVVAGVADQRLARATGGADPTGCSREAA